MMKHFSSTIVFKYYWKEILLITAVASIGVWQLHSASRKIKVIPVANLSEVAAKGKRMKVEEGEQKSPSPKARLMPKNHYSEPAKEPARQVFQFETRRPTVEEWVRQMQALRGNSFSEEEREAALDFLAGRVSPEGMGKASMQWLADELLTALRLEDPPWEGLAVALGETAFQSNTDPVVRDYIMQHLGHLWEQTGELPEAQAALWRGVESLDPTTPGSSLIALSKGYQREGDTENLAKVRRRALEMAGDESVSLASRSTALGIACDGGGAEAKALAEKLINNREAPLILQRVAQHALSTTGDER